MTIQDPQPQSRRAARESERAERAAMGFDSELPPDFDDSEVRSRSGGRRVLADEAGAGEPLDYSTQARYDASPFQVTMPAPAPSASSIPEPGPSSPQFRQRDYSPEGRRAAAQPQPTTSSPLDYHTQQGAGIHYPSDAQVPVTAEALASAPPPTVPPVMPAFSSPQAAPRPAPVLEPEAETEQSSAPEAAADTSASVDEQRPLTRRELRMMRAQAEAANAPVEPELVFAQPAPSVDQPVPSIESAPFTEPAPLVEPEERTASRRDIDEAVASAEIIDRVPGFESLVNPPPVADSRVASDIPMPFAFAAPTVAPERRVTDSATSAPEAFSTETPADPEDVEVDTVLHAPSTPAFAEPPVQRTSYTPPPGHWSRQADLDDETQPFENTLSREVGGGAVTTTTSALILPSIPQSDFASAITGTGEILVTGSINLPLGFSTTGADVRHMESPDVDRMFEAFDGEIVSNDSQPVRAIRAVSTHTSTQSVIVQPRKTHSNRLLTIGVITAGVLIVGVIGLLAVYVLKLT